ncbi:MAG: hypothetical protein E4G91_06605 [Candidatus Zixiibacteriota bacterium]|nr:MAG: hypothetical protein E4G91_06605 [candidate division Zixibacteria bacterium]
MKKTYLIFSAVLVVLILAFSFTKTYLHSLEDEAKWKQRTAAIHADLDSLEREIQSRFDESRAFSSVPDDSQKQQEDQMEPESTVVIPAPAEPVSEEPIKIKSEKKNDLAAAADNMDAEPTADELAIYRLYVQRRLSLPSVITAYKLRLAKEQIQADLGQSYGITAEQVLKIVDKVYEYRRKGNGN